MGAWTTTTNTHISFIQCANADNSAVGAATATVVTEIGLKITGGAAINVVKGANIALTGLTATNHVCWNAGTSANAATCGVAASATDAGTSGCSAALGSSATTLNVAWTTTTNRYISFIECGNGGSSAVNAARSTVVTEIVVTT